MNKWQESALYEQINREINDEKIIYPQEAYDKILTRIPPTIIKQLTEMGWNVFGIYEVVKDELEKERRTKQNVNIQSQQGQ